MLTVVIPRAFSIALAAAAPEPAPIGLLVGGAIAGLVVGGLLGTLLTAGSLRARLRVAEDRLRRAEPAVGEAAELRAALAAERARREADAERLAWIHTADEQLRSSFDALARRALDASADTLTEQAGLRLHGVVEPLREALGALDAGVRTLEKERRGDVEGLRREIGLLRDAHQALRTSADDLRRALASPGGRGRWGEVQLRRLVEMAGLVEHVDFVEQPTTEAGQRPDLVVRLPGGAALPVDAKAPLAAYLQASEADDDGARRAALDRHLQALRTRTADLGGKRYWKDLGAALGEAPDFVVMFLPHEGALSAAFARDPAFLDFALEQRVMPATPVTLLALLKAVAWTWRRQTVAREAEHIAAAGRTLHERLGVFFDHLGRIGRGLDGAVESYNRAVGSLERRVMPSARRLEESAGVADALDEPPQIERAPRSVG
ncbi:MAG: DNA recombination protein RmuC [Acidobacteriota bacterium]